MITSIDRLPSRPELYERILAEIQSPDCSASNVGRIVSSDIAMSARLLQIVNSSFFGLPNRVSDPVQAVNLLGIDLIKVLVLIAGIFTGDGLPKINGVSIDAVVNHSMAVGTYAQAIARAEGADAHTVDDSLLSGMMHDIGKVLLGMSVPRDYEQIIQRVEESQGNLSSEEEKTFRATHADVGGYLLDLWGLAHPVVEAVTFHHTPRQAVGEGFSPLVAVHVANALEAGHYGDSLHDDSNLLDEAFLEDRGLAHRLPLWREIIEELADRKEA